MIAESRFGRRLVSFRGLLRTWAVVLSAVAVGCGGSGDSGASSGLTYSGATKQAVISLDNAQALAASAVDAGSSGTGLSGIASLDADGQPADGAGRPFFLWVAMVMERATAEWDLQSTTEQQPSLAIESATDTFPGGCGGDYSYSIQSDTDTGVFSGNLVFHAFCQDGITLNGATGFSGMINIGMRQVESCTMNFNAITGTSASESVTMGGQFYLTTSGSTTMTTMDMMVRDNNTGRVCKIENYQIDITDRGAHTEITVSGRYYDPDYGYVDLETGAMWLTDDADAYPRSGQLVLTGENGVAGEPTKARLTALSATQCQVEADTDGDGIYDYDSGAILWTDL